jgi:hypothetical protein
MKRSGEPDRSTLRFTPEQVRKARQYAELPTGPLWGELMVLLYGDALAPHAEEWSLYMTVDYAQYWVSNLGSFAVWRETPARLWERGLHLKAVLYVKGKKRARDIHPMVARAFCTWKPGDTVVRHLNSDPRDNRATNLQPGTQLENMRDLRNRRAGIVPKVEFIETEEWRLSPEYAGVRVSNLGNVKIGWWVAFNTVGYFIKTGPRAGSKKHVGVTFNIGGKKRTIGLHRVIWEAFRGAIPPGQYVLHINDDPHDNRLANLAVGTAKQNANDRNRNGHQRFGEDHPNSKYTDEQRRHLVNLISGGMSVTEAAESAGIEIFAAYRIAKRAKDGLRFTSQSL